jgi:hypothetical protein
MANWSRSEAIALLSLLVAVVSCVAGLSVVPEVRHFFGMPSSVEQAGDLPNQPISLSSASPASNSRPATPPKLNPSSTPEISRSPDTKVEADPIVHAGLANEDTVLEESKSPRGELEVATRVAWSPNSSVTRPLGSTIEIPAVQFSRGGNIEAGVLPYGDVIHNAAPYGPAPNWAEYDFRVAGEGEYDIWIEYAADESRPVDILLNGRTVSTNALAGATGGWHLGNQRLSRQGTVRLSGGLNTLRLERNNVFPHIRTIRLVPMN